MCTLLYKLDNAKDKTMEAIEVTGIVDSQGHLQLDRPLGNNKAQRVRVIVLISNDLADDDSIDEQAWNKAAATNPSFAFLQDDDEDIYTLNDGQPVNYEG
jgi:hypothetical protein